MARASGVSPRDFLGRDLVAEMLRFRRGNGSFSGYISYTAFGILALRAAGESASSARVRKAAAWLLRQHNSDGGYGVHPSSASDIDNTGAVLQALAAAGKGGGRVARRAVGYLRRGQNGDGGFGATPIRDSNSQSTAYAVLGLQAVGRNPERFGRRSPLAFLRSMQRGDGSVRFSRASAQTPVWVTAQALLAFERKPLPLAPARLAGRDVSPSPGDSGERAPRKKRKRDDGESRGGASDDDEAPDAPAAPSQSVPPPTGVAPAGGPAGANSSDEGGEGGGSDTAATLGALAGGTLVVAGIWWRRRRRAA